GSRWSARDRSIRRRGESMGYSLGAVIVGAALDAPVEDVLARIVGRCYTAARPVSLVDATRADFDGTAAGRYLDRTLIVDHALPWDCSFREDALGPLDDRLAELSRAAPALCITVDETSMTFAFAAFEDGRRVRVRQV